MAKFVEFDAVVTGLNGGRKVVLNVDQIAFFAQAGDTTHDPDAATKITFASGSVVVSQSVASVSSAIAV